MQRHPGHRSHPARRRLSRSYQRWILDELEPRTLFTGTLLAATQDLGSSIGPDVADTGRNLAYVVDQGRNLLLAINTDTGTTAAIQSLPAIAGGLAVSMDDTTLYVSEPGAFRIQEFSLPTLAPIGSLDIGSSVYQIVVGVNNRIYGNTNNALDGTGSILVFDAQSAAQLYNLSGNYDELIRASPDGTRLYSRDRGLSGDDSSITTWDVSGTGAPVSLPKISGPTGANSTDFLVDTVNGNAYFEDGGVNGIEVTHLSNNSKTTWNFVNGGGAGNGLAALPGASFVYASNFFGNIEQFNLSGTAIATVGLTQAASDETLVITPNGNLLCTYGTGISIVGINKLNVTESHTTFTTLASASQTLGGTIGPDVADTGRNLAYVVDQGRHLLLAINTDTGTTASLQNLTANAGGLAVSMDDSTLYVSIPSLNQIAEFSLPDLSPAGTLSIGSAVYQIVAGVNNRIYGDTNNELDGVGSILVFNTQSTSSLYTLSADYDGLIHASADGTRLYSRARGLSGNDGSINVWDISGTGAPINLSGISGPTGANSTDFLVDTANGMAYFEDGGADGIEVTRLSNGNQTLWNYPNDGGAGNGLAELPGGSYVFTSTFNGDVEQFNLLGLGVASVSLPNGVNDETLVITPNGHLISTYGDGISIIGLSSLHLSETPTPKLAFHVQPVSTIAGALSAITIYIENPDNSIATANNSSVTLSIATGPAGAALSGFQTVTAVHGVATFNNLLLAAAGTYTLQATDGSLTLSSASFIISPAAAGQIAFPQPPANAIAGSIISPALAVDVEDIYGNLITTDSSSTVTLSLNGSVGTLSGTLSQPVHNGIATFDDLSMQHAGTFSFDAVDGALPFISSASFVIAPEAASQLVFVHEPGGSVAGAFINPAMTVALEDPFGNIATSTNGTVTLSLAAGPLGATASGALTDVAVSGIATFSKVSLATVGTYSFLAQAPSLAGATSSSFTIVPAAVSKLQFLQQPSDALAGAVIAPPVTVQLFDRFGNLATNASSSISLVAADTASTLLAGTLTAASHNGLATFNDLIVNSAGTVTLLAVAGPGISVASDPFDISFPAARLQLLQQPSATIAGETITNATGSTPALIVEVTDGQGNLALLDDSTLTVAPVNPNATLHGVTSVPVVNGIAVFSGLSIDQAGPYALQFTNGQLSPLTSSAFTVTPDLASSQIVFSQVPGAALVGKPLAPNIVVKAVDQFGNLITTDHSRLVLSDTSAAFTGVSAVALNKGLATFSNITFKTAGDQTLIVTPATNSTLAIATPITFNETVAQALTVIPTSAVKAAGYAFGATIPLTDSLTSNVPSKTIPFNSTASSPTLVIAGTDNIAAASFTAAGVAKFNVPVLDAGSYICQIIYPGDQNHTAATGSIFTLTINHAKTTTTLIPSASTLVFGQTLTLTAAVKSSSAPAVPRTGSGEFLDNGTPVGTILLNGSSSASLSFVPSATGSQNFQALYLGDTDFAASNSALLKRTVARDKSTILLTASQASPIALNQIFNIDVQVSLIAPGVSAITGDLVTIKDHGKLLGTLTLDSAGRGSLAGLSFTASGTHTLTALFAGDGDALPASSLTLKLVSS